MTCPQCGGEMWDNTAPGAKKNPKGPDYKCKDKDCAHAVWLPKGTKPAAKAATPAVKPAPTGAIDWSQVQRDYTAVIYTAAHALAKGLGCAVTDVDQQAVQAGAATLLIQLEKQGHKLGTLAPKKPKPPTKEELSEPPAALQDDSDVPF